jgi:hypothetical protein
MKNPNYRINDLFSLCPSYTQCKFYNYGYCVNINRSGKYCLFMSDMSLKFRIEYCQHEVKTNKIKNYGKSNIRK